MKTTRKNSIMMTICALALALVMYNCKKKDEPLPSAPSEEVTKELENITVAPITITPPAPVESTEASVETSAKAAEVNGALGDIAASGVVPASVAAAGDAVTGALSASEMTALTSVNTATLDAVKAGGEMQAELKAALDQAASNPAVQAYLPKFTFPTVGGVTIGGRIAAPKGEGVSTDAATAESIEAVQEASDVCLAAAEATFQGKKTQLDASKSKTDADIAAAYNAYIAPLAAEGTACAAGVPATYAAYRLAIETQVNAALADLEAAKTVLGTLYPVLKALVNIQALNAYSGLNSLQAAALAACTAKTASQTKSAEAARDANLAASKAAYDTALAAATEVKSKLAASCHNQGGGL